MLVKHHCFPEVFLQIPEFCGTNQKVNCFTLCVSILSQGADVKSVDTGKSKSFQIPGTPDRAVIRPDESLDDIKRSLAKMCEKEAKSLKEIEDKKGPSPVQTFLKGSGYEVYKSSYMKILIKFLVIH